MIVINFTHPLNSSQKQKIEELAQELAQESIEKVVDVPFQLDNNQSFIDQVWERANAVGLSSMEWQTEPILVNPPAYAPAGAILLAELHGRMGYFPPIIRLRPVPNSTPPSFEVAELVSLQAIREQAHDSR